ncbi:MAG: BrnT family toxin [Pseudomonadota bacterium]
MTNKIITWDEPKRIGNLAKHGLDFADLTLEFFLNATVVDVHSGRRAAIGTLDDGTVTTIFFELGTQGLSVISLRPASAKERAIHDQTR